MEGHLPIFAHLSPSLPTNLRLSGRLSFLRCRYLFIYLFISFLTERIERFLAYASLTLLDRPLPLFPVPSGSRAFRVTARAFYKAVHNGRQESFDATRGTRTSETTWSSTVSLPLFFSLALSLSLGHDFNRRTLSRTSAPHKLS